MDWKKRSFIPFILSVLASFGVSEEDYCNKSDEKCCRTFVRDDFNETSRSIFVIEPYGRLGNHISAFAHLYQLREELGVDVYIVNQTRHLMSQVFSEATLQTLPVLEDNFCNIDDIPFRDFDLDIRFILTDETYRKGHILLLLDQRVSHLK